MKISKELRKITSFAMMFVMVFGFLAVLGSTVTVNAATDKVKMYSYDAWHIRYGTTGAYVYIQINDNASNKDVSVHYRYRIEEEFEWKDAQASYLTTLSDGSQIWKAQISSYATKYAIKYVGDGQTYWDNNNGNDYTSEDQIGAAPIKANRLNSQYHGDNYEIQTTLKNLAYSKVVKVRYTEDNWATYRDVALSYVSSDTSRGTEIWSTKLSLDFNKRDSFQYCVYYQVNDQTYWDNNFGSNYDSGFNIKQ